MTLPIRGAGPYTFQAGSTIFARYATLDAAIAAILDSFDFLRDMNAELFGWSGERFASSMTRRIVRFEGRTLARITPTAEGEHRVELFGVPARRPRRSPTKKRQVGHLVGETHRPRPCVA